MLIDKIVDTVVEGYVGFYKKTVLPEVEKKFPKSGAPALRIIKSKKWMRRRNKARAAYFRERKKLVQELMESWLKRSAQRARRLNHG